MSQTYLSVFIQFLAIFLPAIGITVGSDALTVTVQTLIVIGAGIWIVIRRFMAGGVTVFGVRK